MIDARVKNEVGRGADISIMYLVDCIIEKANESGASDIHIDPSPDSLRIRLRIDGVLFNTYVLPITIQSELISRIKVLAKLRLDEHQATQDGRFRHLCEAGNYIDVRISIVPTYYGENAVLRVLSDKAEVSTIESLGFSASDTIKIQKALQKSSGMILATGPTGSGKTTTLYTLVKMLNSSEVSIITIEDPIEYAIANIEQIQVNSRTGLTFANGLRSILRQDPNIIMVGEIRDTETASIAVNTALTGHLLLSTLHTNDAATTLPRLLDMGIETYLVASTVNIAIGQRLVRKICNHCKEKIVVSEILSNALSEFSSLFVPGTIIYKGLGCGQCANSGYKGRISINEVLVSDNEIREAILRKASSEELKMIAKKNGMTTMLEDGFLKALSGQTTIDEVLRVIYE